MYICTFWCWFYKQLIVKSKQRRSGMGVRLHGTGPHRAVCFLPVSNQVKIPIVFVRSSSPSPTPGQTTSRLAPSSLQLLPQNQAFPSVSGLLLTDTRAGTFHVFLGGHLDRHGHPRASTCCKVVHHDTQHNAPVVSALHSWTLKVLVGFRLMVVDHYILEKNTIRLIQVCESPGFFARSAALH